MKAKLASLIFLMILVSFSLQAQFQILTTYSGNRIMDMKVYKGDLYVIGAFDTIGGIPAKYIARYDGKQWYSLPIHFVDYFNSDYKMEVYKDDLYIAARTSDTINQPLKNEFITKWNGSTWSVLQDSSIYRQCPVFCNGIYDMAVYDSLLYVVGEFSGTPATPNFTSLGTWNGNLWVESIDTSVVSGLPIIDDIETNDDGIWLSSTFIYHWNKSQLINTNHPGATKSSLIAGENFIYANPYMNTGNGWSQKLLKGGSDDHFFLGNDLFFTRNGVLSKMDTSTFIVEDIDTIPGVNGFAGCQMAFYQGKLIVGLTYGIGSNGPAIYLIDSAQVVSDLKTKNQNSVTLNPNPALDVVRISSVSTILNIIIHDVFGNVVYQSDLNVNEASIDVSNFPRGLYFVKSSSDSHGTQTQKLLIQR